MTNVYEVSARFMRRVQAKEYEPMEAEVSIKAQVTEGENAESVLATVMGLARKGVIENGLKGSTSTGKTEAAASTTAPAEAAPAETKPAAAPKAEGAKGPGRPKKETLTPPAPKEEPKAAPAADPSDPTADEPAAAPEAAAEPDEFDEFAGAEEAAPAPVSLKELQEWINAQIGAKKTDVAAVKGIMAKYNATRSAELKDDDRPKVKAEIEKILKK